MSRPPDTAGLSTPRPATTSSLDCLSRRLTKIAPAGTEAAGHIDLLTVLMHEFGHVLGRTDSPVDHASAR